jgi:hypothetical protein
MESVGVAALYRRSFSAGSLSDMQISRCVPVERLKGGRLGPGE